MNDPTNNQPIKICRICNKNKSLSEFEIRENGNTRSECIECRRIAQKASYQARKLKPKVSVVTKTCIKCNKTKNYSEFRLHPSTPDGLDNKCKECMSEYYKNPNIQKYLEQKKLSGKLKTITKKYRSNHKNEINERACSRRKENNILFKVSNSLYALEKRQRAVIKLGGKCVKCNESNITKLCIDHVNDDGAQERVKFGLNKIISLVLNGNHENRYQVLCWNCNKKKQLSLIRNKDRNDSPLDVNTKTCTQCDKVLPVGLFSKTKHKISGRISYCKYCASSYSMKRRLKVLSILGGLCTKCKNNDQDVLEVDHINNDGCIKRKYEDDKSVYLRIVSGVRSTNDLQLLCSNCNAEKSYLSKLNSKNFNNTYNNVVKNINLYDNIVIDDLIVERCRSIKYEQFLRTNCTYGVGKTPLLVYSVLYHDNIVGVIKFTKVSKSVSKCLSVPHSSIVELERLCLIPELRNTTTLYKIMSIIYTLISNELPCITKLICLLTPDTQCIELNYIKSHWNLYGDMKEECVYKWPSGLIMNYKTVHYLSKSACMTLNDYALANSLNVIHAESKKIYVKIL